MLSSVEASKFAFGEKLYPPLGHFFEYTSSFEQLDRRLYTNLSGDSSIRLTGTGGYKEGSGLSLIGLIGNTGGIINFSPFWIFDSTSVVVI